MRLHIIFDDTSRYSVCLEDFVVEYPRQHTMVLKRIKPLADTLSAHEFIVIGFSKDYIFHCNIYGFEIDLNDDLPWEKIQRVEFKTEY